MNVVLPMLKMLEDTKKDWKQHKWGFYGLCKDYKRILLEKNKSERTD